METKNRVGQLTLRHAAQNAAQDDEAYVCGWFDYWSGIPSIEQPPYQVKDFASCIFAM
ncbi:hypothetical protein SAMN04488595_12919 [Ralstonia sp. 25mfcol4.1]|nr:hypothetical protein SAMN04488595_12919 [Ralstonia sp. 25mfcol4.1]